jgi:nitroimidazol reductase NimA-like FMN-containing flavoprotein (pyridoxamine 5'-phosphate oxidase superfamily)
MITTQDAVVALPEEDAWEFLRTHQLGRLAFHLLGEVHIAPVNYAVTDGRVVFRTAPGSKLLGVVMNDDVAFEVDEVGQDSATSVVARGTARLLRDGEADDVERVGLHSWVPTDKDEVVAVEIREISGRTFRLDRRG